MVMYFFVICGCFNLGQKCFSLIKCTCHINFLIGDGEVHQSIICNTNLPHCCIGMIWGGLLYNYLLRILYLIVQRSHTHMTFMMPMFLQSICTVYLNVCKFRPYCLAVCVSHYIVSSYRLNDCRLLKHSKCMQGPMNPTHIMTFKKENSIFRIIMGMSSESLL